MCIYTDITDYVHIHITYSYMHILYMKYFATSKILIMKLFNIIIKYSKKYVDICTFYKILTLCTLLSPLSGHLNSSISLRYPQ